MDCCMLLIKHQDQTSYMRPAQDRHSLFQAALFSQIQSYQGGTQTPSLAINMTYPDKIK